MTIREEIERHPSLLSLLIYIAYREGYYVECDVRWGFRTVSVEKGTPPDLSVMVGEIEGP